MRYHQNSKRFSPHAGAPLFPGTVNELDQRCSCPDQEVPCKHLAATFYLLAEAFDTDPFLILRWRGRDREPLLHRLRELRTDGPADAGVESASAVPGATGAALALADLAVPSRQPDHFWLPPVPLPARPATLVVESDLVLRQLPTPTPELGGPTLADKLRSAYQRFGITE